MPILQAQVRLARDTNMEEDVVVNTFHFNVAGIDDTQARYESIVTNLAGFYAGSTGSIVALTNWMSSLIQEAASAHKVRIYRLSDPAPRAPVHEGSFSLAPTGAPLPSEVALCLSYRGLCSQGPTPLVGEVASTSAPSAQWQPSAA